MNVDTSIFKSYDIRGVYPTSVSEDVAYSIARAYSELMQKQYPGKKLQIVVGNDMRVSGPSVKKRLVEGLVDSGVDVIDVGLVTTPTFYFAVGYYNFDGGIQVSASHNPKEYNGFKLVKSKGVALSGEKGINQIRDMVVKGAFKDSPSKGSVSRKEGVLSEAFSVLSEGIDIKGIKPFKVVVDAANAMGALDVEEIFKHLPCELIKMNFELDGNFPNHPPDPLVEENLEPLKKAVLEHKADLGIAPDGDGDRYFFVDEKGETVRQEILRGIMAQIAIKENPGSTVCYDIRPGKITKDMIESAGGKAVVTKVGHSLIKETMIENDAVFGGESSGHYFYKFGFGTFEAPIVFVLKFLLYVSQQNKPVSEVIAPYKKYFHSGEINSKVENYQKVFDALKEKYKDAGEISFLDGITVTFDDFWFNVRGSNTEPLLRLNLEATSKEVMEQKRDEVLGIIRG